MDDDKIGTKSVRVEYISTKTDKYDNEIIYFKMEDKNVDSKFAILMKPHIFYPGSNQIKGITF